MSTKMPLFNLENPHLREQLKIAFIGSLYRLIERNDYPKREYDELLDSLIGLRDWERENP